MKTKKVIVIIMLITNLMGNTSLAFATEKKDQVSANPTKEKVTLDGKQVNFTAFNIEGNNYFMLRDIAYLLKNTKAEFEVAWDQEKCAINLQTGKAYSGTDIDFEKKASHIKEIGNRSRAKIYKNGKELELLGYTIKANTYFKLRDLGEELGFSVEWDPKNQVVEIMSDIGKREIKKEELEETNAEKEKKIKPTSERQKQEMREEMLILINEARKKEGLAPLRLNNELIEMSEFKAKDMKKLDKLSHEGSYGSFKDLLSLYNIQYQMSGENVLFRGRSVQDMFDLWWNSPGHRANIMNPKYRQVGIGFEDIEVEKRTSVLKSDELKKIAEYDEVRGIYTYPKIKYWCVQQFTD